MSSSKNKLSVFERTRDRAGFRRLSKTKYRNMLKHYREGNGPLSQSLVMQHLGML